MHRKNLPSFYQNALHPHLSKSQYLTLELLLLLLQSFRQVKLSRLASLFPQPIQYQSRLRNLQRFLALPQLQVRLLWFPILKYWIRQEFRGRNLNRAQRRRLKQLKRKRDNYLLIALDRTQWQGRNLIVASLIWGKHVLPIYWKLLSKKGCSNLGEQKAILNPVLKLLKPYPIFVLGDREFHSPKLAKFLCKRDVGFALRQKKDKNITENGQDYSSLGDLNLEPGNSAFFMSIFCNKEDSLGPFNFAAYWKRKYRGKGPKESWYILTTCPTLKQALRLYRARWGIEVMFKDCKTGGFNLEDTKVNDVRFLALFLLIAIAYSLATCQGSFLRKSGVEVYIARLKQYGRQNPKHSDFWLGLYGYVWGCAMEVWADWATHLMALKPHKRLYFRRGLNALSLIQSTV